MALIRLREAFTQYRQSMERCQAMTTLSQTASGELAGRPKLAFEQYIQAFYFEYVLKAANQRLKILSRGQYTLLRRVQGGNLRSADGLELEVLDHYTGRRRPVSSLSGGESFPVESKWMPCLSTRGSVRWIRWLLPRRWKPWPDCPKETVW